MPVNAGLGAPQGSLEHTEQSMIEFTLVVKITAEQIAKLAKYLVALLLLV